MNFDDILTMYGKNILETFSLALLKLPNVADAVVGHEVSLQNEAGAVLATGKVIHVLHEGFPYVIAALQYVRFSVTLVIETPEIDLSVLKAEASPMPIR